MRLYALAKETGVSTRQMLEQALALGITAKSNVAVLTDDEAARLRAALTRPPAAPAAKTPRPGRAKAKHPPARPDARRKGKTADEKAPAAAPAAEPRKKPAPNAESPAAAARVRGRKKPSPPTQPEKAAPPRAQAAVAAEKTPRAATRKKPSVAPEPQKAVLPEKPQTPSDAAPAEAPRKRSPKRPQHAGPEAGAAPRKPRPRTSQRRAPAGTPPPEPPVEAPIREASEPAAAALQEVVPQAPQPVVPQPAAEPPAPGAEAAVTPAAAEAAVAAPTETAPEAGPAPTEPPSPPSPGPGDTLVTLVGKLDTLEKHLEQLLQKEEGGDRAGEADRAQMLHVLKERRKQILAQPWKPPATQKPAPLPYRWPAPAEEGAAAKEATEDVAARDEEPSPADRQVSAPAAAAEVADRPAAPPSEPVEEDEPTDLDTLALSLHAIEEPSGPPSGGSPAAPPSGAVPSAAARAMRASLEKQIGAPAQETAENGPAAAVALSQVAEQGILAPGETKTGDVPRLLAYRCESCASTEIRARPRANDLCPRCGARRVVRERIVGGAYGYSLADRSKGVNIEDRRLGCTAFFCGFLNLRQVAACLQLQHQAHERGERVAPFGEVAISGGLLTPKQVDALLRIQAIHRVSEHDRALGALAMRRGLVSQERLDECLEEQERLLRERLEAPHLGILMVEKRLLRAEQVRELLAEQVRRGKSVADEALEEAQKQAEAETSLVPMPQEAAVLTDEALAALTVPPPPRPGETRIVCRCEACGRTEIRRSWTAEVRCPECGSNTFAPVPVTDDAFDYVAAPRRLGPALEDGRLGCMAYLAGWMDEEQVRECLEEQNRAVEAGEPVPRFGETAIARGYLNAVQVSALLRIQAIHRPARHDRSLGALAVQAGYLTQEQLDDCLEEQERLLRERGEAPLLGLLMTEKKLLTSRQVRALLTYQEQNNEGPLPLLREAVAPPRRRFEGLGRAVLSRSSALATAGAAMLIVGIIGLQTGWFGLLRWQAPDVIAGCKVCGKVVTVSVLTGEAKCPSCGRPWTLAPLVQCTHCRHIYLFGATASGLKCPQCGSKEYMPLRHPLQAGTGWQRPPVPDDAPPAEASPGDVAAR